MHMDLTNRKFRKSFLDFNRLIKVVYDVYFVNEKNMVLPLSMETIHDPVFQESIFLWHRTNEPLNALHHYGCDPTLIVKAINNKNYNLEEKKEQLYLGDDFHIGTKASKKQIEDSYHYQGLNLYQNKPVDYITYQLEDSVKQQLTNYETFPIVLGKFHDQEIKLIATVKLFPCIKKANTIILTCWQDENVVDEKLFHLIIGSLHDDWTFYSNHMLLNY